MGPLSQSQRCIPSRTSNHGISTNDTENESQTVVDTFGSVRVKTGAFSIPHNLHHCPLFLPRRTRCRRHNAT